MSRVLEWHMPENVVDQMNDVLVHEILFLEKFIRRRATGTHTQRGSGKAQQALKQITLICPTQPRYGVPAARGGVAVASLPQRGRILLGEAAPPLGPPA